MTTVLRVKYPSPRPSLSRAYHNYIHDISHNMELFHICRYMLDEYNVTYHEIGNIYIITPSRVCFLQHKSSSKAEKV